MLAEGNHNIRDDSSSSREVRNIQQWQGRQQQEQDLTTRTLATVGSTAAKTIKTSQVSPAAAGTPTATEVSETAWRHTTHDFWENLRKNSSEQ